MITATTFSIAFGALILVPAVLQLFGFPAMLAGLGRALGFMGLGALSFLTGFLPLWASLLVAGTPFIVTFLMQVYFIWRGRRALGGAYGKKQQWVAEFIRDDDAEFLWAVENISEMDVKEVMLVADSKQQLKELAVERAEEQ